VHDKLVVAVRDSWWDAAARAEIAVARVVREISDMGLQVAVQKTEALYFYGKASGKPLPTHIGLEGTSILVGDRVKYLGCLLDGTWTFGYHFDPLAPRMERVAAALALPVPWGSGWSGAPDVHGHRQFGGIIRRTRVGSGPGGLATEKRYAPPHSTLHGRQGG